MGTLVDVMLSGLLVVIATSITLWMAGAIYYDVFGATRWGQLATVVWLMGVVVAFALWSPRWQPFVSLLAVMALFLLWWFRQQPSHTHDWHPSVAILPRATCEGECITIENLRNFEYRSLEDYTPRYETRIVRLAHLRGVDIIFFNWGSAVMSHPLLVFDFGPDGRVCISIEVRYRKGQDFSILRSLYRQQELIFVVTDERDSILRRTKFGKPQEAHLYHVIATEEELRGVFMDFVQAINDLHMKPRWYHGLCANCTTSFYCLPSSRIRWDWRVIANARLDRALYEIGRLDQSLPFADLRRVSYLNEIANRAPEDGFGDYIRLELERRRHER